MCADSVAVFVRRASRTGVITATIVCALVTVYFVFEVLNSARLAISGNPALIAAGCFTLIPLSLFGLITLWLVQLLHALPGIDAAQTVSIAILSEPATAMAIQRQSARRSGIWWISAAGADAGSAADRAGIRDAATSSSDGGQSKSEARIPEIRLNPK